MSGSGDVQVYTLAFATVNGGILTQNSGIAMERTTGSQPVLTLLRGYAGESPGAGMTTISLQNVVPAVDFEFMADVFMESLTAVEIGVNVASRIMVCKGFIIKDSYKQSVNGEGQYDMDFRGGFTRFQ